MKGIVIYQSKYGAAQQYAEWIAEALNISAKSTEDLGKGELANCDFVIAGSSIYMGKILLKNWLARHSEILKGKKLFLFIVGAAPSIEKEKTNNYFTDNISKEMLSRSKCFYLQGKSIFSELSWTDKFFLKMGAMLAKDPRDKKAMLTDFNAMGKENLADLLDTVRNFLAPKANAGKSFVYHRD